MRAAVRTERLRNPFRYRISLLIQQGNERHHRGDVIDGIIAVDPRVIPLGTAMFVVGESGDWTYGYAVAGDIGGGGYLRLMQFDETAHEIRCVNYSPYLDDYNWLDEPHPPEKDHRYEMDEKSESFTLKMPWA